jgi:hypothetical protein
MKEMEALAKPTQEPPSSHIIDVQKFQIHFHI